MFKFMDIFVPKKRKTGIIRLEKIGEKGEIYNVIFEVEEIKKINDLSKIKVLKCSSNICQMPVWVHAGNIEWDME